MSRELSAWIALKFQPVSVGTQKHWHAPASYPLSTMIDEPLQPAPRERRARLSDQEYLVLIERLAQDVYEAAVDERGAAIFHSEANTTPLDRAIYELVVKIRRVHYDGDGLRAVLRSVEVDDASP